MKLYTARSLLIAPGEFYPGGGILCDDRVRGVAHSADALRRLSQGSGVPIEDLGDGLLAPGLVNAHAHLELTGLDAGSDRSFRGWLGGLMAARGASTHGERVAATLRGADRLQQSGSTSVGDIDSTGAAQEALRRHGMRVCLYREVIDACDPERTPKALKHVARRMKRRRGMTEGVSPHAPYTVSAGLFGGLSALAQKRGMPVTIHWSETPEEIEWTLHGTGPLAGLIEHVPGRAGLDLIERAGLLNPGTSLVHGNYPAEGELERIARAGTTCVHCPGSHAYFGREPFPMDAYLAAGVSVALGTDSEASNDDLDMRREMSLLRDAHPGLRPERVWSMATVHGARALGVSEEPGTLREGAFADFCLYEITADGLGDGLEKLTAGRPPVLGTWIGGRRAPAV